MIVQWIEEPGRLGASSLLSFTDSNFDQEVLKSTKPVLVEFMSAYCDVCKNFADTFEQIAAEHPEVKIGQFSIDQSRTVAVKYAVKGTPTFIAFSGGQEVGRLFGIVPGPAGKDQIEQMIAQLKAAAPAITPAAAITAAAVIQAGQTQPRPSAGPPGKNLPPTQRPSAGPPGKNLLPTTAPTTALSCVDQCLANTTNPTPEDIANCAALCSGQPLPFPGGATAPAPEPPAPAPPTPAPVPAPAPAAPAPAPTITPAPTSRTPPAPSSNVGTVLVVVGGIALVGLIINAMIKT